jgi:hypothetical protein
VVIPQARTLFEGHRHPDQAHRHDLGEVAFPRGFISLWYGAAADCPAGWAICDGTNGTPDMRGRVAVGVDAGQTEFDALDESGGSKTSTAPHTHDLANHNHATTSGAPSITSTGVPSVQSTGTPSATNTGVEPQEHTHTFTSNNQSVNHAHQFSIPVGTSGGNYGLIDSGNSGSSGTPATTGQDADHTHNGTSDGRSATHTHSLSSHTHIMNDHSHSMQSHTHTGTSGVPSNNSSGASSAAATSGNLQPYRALHYIMKIA